MTYGYLPWFGTDFAKDINENTLHQIIRNAGILKVVNGKPRKEERALVQAEAIDEHFSKTHDHCEGIDARLLFNFDEMVS